MSNIAPPYTAPTFKLHHGDCLNVMPTLNAGSVDMVFADLPYGITRNRWDCCLSFNELWQGFDVCCKAHAVQCFTATQPFATHIINSRAKNFKYDLVWQKSIATGHLNAKKAPLRCHENVLIFCGSRTSYTPQMIDCGGFAVNRIRRASQGSTNYGKQKDSHYVSSGKRFPQSILPIASRRVNGLHPTQKPVALLEWLIATYTNLGDTVLDPCFGSNATGVACARLGRNYIGLETDATYFAAGKARLEAEHARLANASGATATTSQPTT